MVVILSFIFLGIIAFGLWYFERMLARKPSPWPGLTMPILFLIVSISAMFQSIPVIFEDLEAVGGLSGALAFIILCFLITNIATVWVYIVYFRTRKAMGERPWPLRPLKEDSETAEENAEETTEKIEDTQETVD